ncbi:Hypothetical predicted protein, partial [Marmota monax]
CGLRGAQAQTARAGLAARRERRVVSAILSRSPVPAATTSPVNLRGGTSYSHCPAGSLFPLPGAGASGCSRAARGQVGFPGETGVETEEAAKATR